MATLLSVNTSLPKEVVHNGSIITTGIFKEPVSGRVSLHALNLKGDGQADLMAHGGTYKAVYAYPYEHYAYWQQQLKRDDFSYGQFGENFTTEGLLETEVYIGDVFRIGTAFVEVTQPRVPCYKLALKMGLPTFVKQFLQAERPGFYLRVIQEGEVGAGDSIERVKVDSHQMSVWQVNHLLYFDPANIAQVERAAQLPALSPGWRDALAALAARHQSSS